MSTESPNSGAAGTARRADRRAARGVPLLSARPAHREAAGRRAAAEPPARPASRDGPRPHGAPPAVATDRRAAHAGHTRIPRLRGGDHRPGGGGGALDAPRRRRRRLPRRSASLVREPGTVIAVGYSVVLLVPVS